MNDKEKTDPTARARELCERRDAGESYRALTTMIASEVPGLLAVIDDLAEQRQRAMAMGWTSVALDEVERPSTIPRGAPNSIMRRAQEIGQRLAKAERDVETMRAALRVARKEITRSGGFSCAIIDEIDAAIATEEGKR